MQVSCLLDASGDDALTAVLGWPLKAAAASAGKVFLQKADLYREVLRRGGPGLSGLERHLVVIRGAVARAPEPWSCSLMLHFAFLLGSGVS